MLKRAKHLTSIVATHNKQLLNHFVELVFEALIFNEMIKIYMRLTIFHITVVRGWQKNTPYFVNFFYILFSYFMKGNFIFVFFLPQTK